MFIKKVPDLIAATVLIHQAAVQIGELIKKNSDVPKSETLLYFTKITAATWSTNKIIPVSIALGSSPNSIASHLTKETCDHGLLTLPKLFKLSEL